MSNYSYIALIPLLPFISFILLGLWGRKNFRSFSGIIGTVSILATTILSIYAACQYFFIEGAEMGAYQKIIVLNYSWLEFSPGLSIDMGILLDPVSVMMLVVVSFVSLMVHLFSLGYMKGEERFATYYSFLSLFSFSMLGLVLSANIFQIYIFWELVGVSSYLLIGFYYERPSAVAASKKAFIVTRFADLGFLVGILILGFYAGTLDFGTLISRLGSTSSTEFLQISAASFLGVSMLTWALGLVFIGGAGKSAMFPLHIWLPDAMEGPTPVSALIHAATMVVAGVYLVARLFPLFAIADAALELVTYTGAFSAILAAIIACTQTDIKRILAFSTMSQIGFMMFALGVSGPSDAGYTASMFHLFTHAFFKSLLFLGAGAVIHLVHSNNMKDMGGLRKLMPLTHICFLIGCLAIAGIPPFAGFFSKEEILMAAYQSNAFIFYVGILTSALTAFYMFRLYFSLFWKKEAKELVLHHGEGSLSMKLPLVALAICSTIAGFIPFSNFVTANGRPAEVHFDLLFSIAPVTLSLIAIVLATLLYKKENEMPGRIAALFGGLYKAACRKFYIDEVYLFITRKIIFNMVGRPAAWIDKHIIDGSVNMAAYVTGRTSEWIRVVQSGRVQWYALFFFCGIASLAVLFIYFWK